MKKPSPFPDYITDYICGSFGTSGGVSSASGGISFSAGYPLDVATAQGATFSAAYGIGALTSAGKTGPLFDMVVGGVVTTIHGVGPGYPDVATIASVLGVSPSSGISGASVSRWYDQSGNAADATQEPVNCTISNASPGVVTLANNLSANEVVVFKAGSGTLPSQIIAGTPYFVIATGLSAASFEVSATVGGSAINTTGGSGTVQVSILNRQPMIWLINGKVSIYFSGVLSAAPQSPYLASAASINNRAVTIFGAATPANSGNAPQFKYGPLVGSGSYGTVTGTEMAFSINSSADAAGTGQTTANATTGDFTAGLQQNIQPYLGIQPSIAMMQGGASSTLLKINGTTSAAGAALTAGTSGTILGNTSPGLGAYTGRMQAITISPSVLNSTQYNALAASLATWAGIATNANRANTLNVAVDGASTDQGQGSVPGPASSYQTLSIGGYGYTEQLKDFFASQGKQVSWHNFARGGQTIANRTTDYTSGFVQASSFQSGSTTNILLAPGVSIVAELVADSGNATIAFANFQTWLIAAQSVAWTRVAVIAYPDATTAGMAVYNTLLFANISLGYDIIDGRTVLLPLLAPFGNAYTQSDGHPTVMGSSVYVQLIQPYFQMFL